MNKKHDSLLSQAGNAAVGSLVLVWVANFFFTTRLGAFLLLSFIAGFGSLILVCGAINTVMWDVFDDYSFAPEECGWIHAFCWGGGALFTVGFMAKEGLWGRPVEKPEAEEDEDEDED